MEKINVRFDLTEQQKAARMQLIDQVLHDPRVQAFQKAHALSDATIRAHAQRFADWSSEMALCVGCPGLHACRQKQTGYVLDLELEGYLQPVLKPCAYQAQIDQQTAHAKQYLHRDGGQELLLADQEGLLLAPFEHDYLITLQPIKEWLETPSTKGFFIHGPSGVGKTYLAAAVLNAFAKNGQTVALVHVPTLAITLKQSFDAPDHIESLLATLKRAKFVVFDDLGAESSSGWFRDEILLPLLNYRMEHQKKTWFTSNLTPEGLRAHFRYNQKGDDEALKATRIMERIEALSAPLLMRGKNRRNPG